MSTLLGMCPAPFQRPKKNKSKAPVKSNKSSSRRPAPLPTIIDQLPLAPVAGRQPQHHHMHRGGQVRSGHHHHMHHPAPHPTCCCENECLQSATSSCTSNESHSTHTSGYQSGYQTDDGTFEGKMLVKASQQRPANLRMTAIRDYTPCCHEELAVRKGQRVKVLYKNNDWVYAVTKSGEAGYIPYTFVRPSRKYAGYQSEPEYCQETDATYQSGYDTDLPVGPRRAKVHAPHHHNHRTQIGDVPMYSVHTGFSGSPEMAHKRRQVDGRKHSVSGYTSAVECHTNPPAHSRHPRPAKSLHCILDASSPRMHRPAEPKPISYERTFLEELVVIHDFEAKEEDEVFVGKGERVKVLNAEDPFWLWVETTPGDQGFVPRSCCSLGNHELLHSSASRRASSSSRPQQSGSSRHARKYYHERSRAQTVAKQARSTAKQRFHELARLRNTPHNPVLMNKEEIQRVGSKLIVLMDYTATQDDEMTVEFAETIFADVLKQAGAERIWAFCPRTDLCGYVPVSLVVPPVV